MFCAFGYFHGEELFLSEYAKILEQLFRVKVQPNFLWGTDLRFWDWPFGDSWGKTSSTNVSDLIP